jgi:hypothetical protein
LLAIGTPALVANATSCLIVLPGQVAAVYGYRKYLDKIPRRYLLLAVPTMLGAAIGVYFLKHTTVERFQQLIPCLIFFAVTLFVFQPFLHDHAHRHIHGPKKHRDSWKPLLLLCLAFFPVSIYGGYFGAGFGFIMLAFLGFTKVHEMHRMNALKNLLALGVAITSLTSLAGTNLISWRHGITMGIGAMIGAYVGARQVQKFSSHTVRIAVIIIGLITATYLAIPKN